MEATQILMMPVTGMVPAVTGEPGTADVAGNQPVEQFGALLGQVLESLQNAEAKLAAVPVLDNESVVFASELPVQLDEQTGDADAGVIAQLLGGYQQMLATQQVVVSGTQETDVSGTSPDEGIDTVLTELAKTGDGGQRLSVTNDDNLPAVSTEEVPSVVAAAKRLENGILPAEHQEEKRYQHHSPEQQVPAPAKPAMVATSADETAAHYGESAQQTRISELHSRKLQAALPTQNQALVQTQTADRQTHELAEQGRIAGVQQSSPPHAGSQVESLRLPEAQTVSVNNEAGGKNGSQPVTQFRFAQSADVTAAAGAAGSQSNTASGFGTEGRETDRQLADASVGQMAMEEGALELKGEMPLPSKHADPLLPGVQSPRISTAESVVAPDALRTVQHEQVARQVTERLSGYEVKSGADQLSLKLSPEHLGNLQLTFKMEDQRLKLEIVAENRGVRDALLQQADDLKESLARQNIKVDSFDVTTANGNSMSQQQRDWRQMAAEQRQYQPQFVTSRNVVDGAKPEAAVRYFAPQYNSTIDVRF